MAEEIIDYLNNKLFDSQRGIFFGCEDFLRREGAGSSSTEEFFTIIDECIYSDANAQAVSAYLDAATLLGRPDCNERALSVLEFLWSCCRTPGARDVSLSRWRTPVPGLLEDQAQVGTALVQAYFAGGDAISRARARTGGFHQRAAKKSRRRLFRFAAAERSALRKFPSDRFGSKRRGRNLLYYDFGVLRAMRGIEMRRAGRWMPLPMISPPTAFTRRASAARCSNISLADLNLDLHIRDDDLVIRVALPDDVSRHAINLRQSVERHDRRLLHDDPPRLLQDRQALFRIAGALFFLDELVEIGIAVAGALGDAGVKILIVEGVRVIS